MSDLISIGIVLFDEITLFEKQIQSLLTETSKHSVKEFLFILTSPNAETRERFKQIFDSCLINYRYWIFTENHIGKARSMLVNECQTPLLYMIDPDIEIPAGSIHHLLNQTDHFQQDICGLAGEAYLKSKSDELNRFLNLIQKINRSLKNNNQMLTYSLNQKIQHAPTCHLLLDVQKIKSVGNFSANYSCVGEDLDLSHRLADNGLNYLFIQNCRVYHLQNLTNSKWYQKMFKYGLAQAVCFNNNGYKSFMNHKYLLFFIGLLSVCVLLLFPIQTLLLLSFAFVVSFLFFKNIFIMVNSSMIYFTGICCGLFLRKKTT